MSNRGRYWLTGLLGLALVALAGAQIGRASAGLEFIRIRSADLPVTVVQPRDTLPASRPLVLVAHGFAGSEVIMRGFSLTLAHAGYTVVAHDFTGHGRNQVEALQRDERESHRLEQPSGSRGKKGTQ